ncbi:MAG TPA: NAD-dependent epimerase/dehydratase family protein [Rubricoccaceae bacterium]
MTDSRTVFVTGATGVVGPVLVRRLLADGWTVRALVRRPNAPLPAGTVAVVGDLDDEAALARGAEGAEAVVHLAALLHVVDPPPDLDALYLRVNIDGTRRLVAAAEAAGVARVVFASTINVYGPSRGGAPWTEASATHPDSAYARTKLEAESIVRTLPAGVVLRLAAVVGPGMKGNYPSLQRVLGAGLRLLPGDGANRRTLVHVADAAAAFALAAGGGVPPGTYNLTDGRVHTFDALVRSLQTASGRTPGVRYVPAAPVRMLLGLPTAAARLVGRRVAGPALVDKLVEDIAVAGERLQAASAYRPSVDVLANGWAPAEAAMPEATPPEDR